MSEHIKSKDARKVLEFDITAHRKGFISENSIGGVVTREYFHYREIYKVIHHVGKGVEIVNYNEKRRVFYNDNNSETQVLYDILNNKILKWMNSNRN